MNDKETFRMTYSAQQHEEIQAIRDKYAPPEKDKMQQLRALDASVGKKATIRAVVVGLIGTLIMGAGMSLIMSEFGALLGNAAIPVGIILGVIGICIMACAYPLYNSSVKKERAKIAPEIIRLTDELMK